MFTHYGCDTNKWFPAKSHGALAASDLAPTSLAALTPLVGKLLIPRGIRAMNEWTQYNDGTNGLGQGNDRDLQVVGSYFTLQPVTPNTNDPFSFSSDTKFNARPVGSSLDHVMAQQLSPNGTPLFMRVGNTGGTSGESAQSNISYLKASSAGPTEAAAIYSGLGTPAAVFNMLTGLFGSGPTTPATYAASRGKRVTDLVRGELQALERFDMSGEDRNKLEAWKALVNDTGSMMTSSLCTPDLPITLGATADNVSAAGTYPTNSSSDILTQKITTDLDGADMYSVMAVLATACNYNPVIVLKYPPNFVFKGLGLTNESNNVSKRLSNANLTGTCIPNALDNLQTIDRYYASKFAKLAGMLDGIKNADGSTLLDSTAAVWFNEFSDGLAANLNNLPIIQAGGCGGYFKTGWTVNVDTSEHRFGDPEPGQQRGAVRARQRRAGRRHPPGHRNRSERRQRADQQVLLQPDERPGREGGRGRVSGEGGDQGGEPVRLLRPDHRLQGRPGRRGGGDHPQPRRVHRSQVRLVSWPKSERSVGVQRPRWVAQAIPERGVTLRRSRPRSPLAVPAPAAVPVAFLLAARGASGRASAISSTSCIVRTGRTVSLSVM